jgi:intein/homing endonuclease
MPIAKKKALAVVEKSEATEKVKPDALNTALAQFPDIDTNTSIASMEKSDPYLWVATHRRLKGRPLFYDITGEIMKCGTKVIPQHTLLRHRPFLVQPLVDTHPHKVYKKGRQVGVSELSINEVLWFLDSNPGTKIIYTFPRDVQLRDFSITRISEAINESPRMQRLVGTPNQIYTKKIGESYLILRSAWESNLGEGIDADGVTLDEKDRMKEGIDIAFRESLQSSRFGLLRELSTPTLPGRGVDQPYQNSCQYEWFVRCSKCGMRQTVRFPDNIIQVKDVPVGTKQLDEDSYDYQCSKEKCRGKLDRRFGEWVAKFPSKTHIAGYLMPQTIAPWISATKLMQKKIDYKFLQLWMNYCNFSHVWCNGEMFNTFVTTSDGAKLIENVDVGDCVITHKGVSRPVSKLLHRRYTGDRYAFTLGRGSSPHVLVTSGHPLLVLRQGAMVPGELKPEWLKANEVRVHDYLVYPKIRVPETAARPLDVERVLKGVPELVVRGAYMVWARHAGTRETPRSLEVTEDLARFFGLFLAEGCVTHPTTVHHKKERELIEFSCRMFSKLGALPRVVDPSRFPSQRSRNALVVDAGSKTLELLFRAWFGGVGRDKCIPSFVYTWPRSLRLAFLTGYFQGDGSLHKGIFRFVTCSPHVAYGLQRLMSSLGYGVIVRSKSSKLKGRVYSGFTLDLTGLQRLMLFNELRPFVLKARHIVGGTVPTSGSEVLSDANNFYFRVSDVKKDRVHNEKVYNFEVEKDHSYITNGVVSHNCLAECSVGERILLSDEDFYASIAGHQWFTCRTNQWSRIIASVDWGHFNWCLVIGVNAFNNLPYLIGMHVCEDNDRDPLGTAKSMDDFLRPFDPDLILADSGYGKDRNAYLLKRWEYKFYAVYYNPSDKHSRTFKPQFIEASNRVIADRTITLKSACQIIREHGLGLPAYDQQLQLLISHCKALAPLQIEEDGDIYEVIDSTGDDHLAHCLGYALIGFDHVTSGWNNFSVTYADEP